VQLIVLTFDRLSWDFNESSPVLNGAVKIVVEDLFDDIGFAHLRGKTIEAQSENIFVVPDDIRPHL
jgi:hypothetical protein